MAKKIVLGLISILLLITPIIVLAGNCDEGKVIPNTDKCKDTDNGQNYGVYGVCRDSTNWNKEWKDYCEAGTLTEYYCSDAGTCMPTGRICDNGCVQSSPSCRPDGKAITYEHNGCDDMDNGIYYYISATCTDGLHSGATPTEHKDSCEGDFLKEWYCSRSSDASSLHSTCPITENDFSHCTIKGTHCAFGCSNGACNKPNFGVITPVSPNEDSDSTNDISTVKCCLNPNNDVCVATTVKECCNGNYNLPNGPKDQKDCENNFFKSGSAPSAPCLGLSDNSCSQACCCVRTYDEDENPIITANLDEYKINCQGKDKIFTDQGCSNARCRSLFESSGNDKTNDNTDNNDLNTGNSDANTEESNINNNDETNNNLNKETNKQYGEICNSGECSEGTLCLKDKDNNEKRCCYASQCLAQGVCFENKTKIHRNGKMFVCENSKWESVQSPAKLIISKSSCEDINGTCRGNFLGIRGFFGWLFRGGNFCNNNEYDHSSCGNGLFGELRCCVRT